MDIVEFNNKSDTLTEKYAPSTVKEIIGAKRQVYALVEWIKKYNVNAKINLQKQNSKKTGKKARRRKLKEIKALCENGSENAVPGVETIDDGLSGGEENVVEEEIDIKKAKKKDPNICSCAIVTGDHGTGKTATVRAVLNGMGYLIKSVNFAKMGTVKSVDDFVENILVGDDIYETMENVTHKKFAIVVDEIQSVSTPTEKGVINGLLKLNSELLSCPVIFIGSNKHKKIMTGVKKECYHISMYAPEAEDMLQLLERVGLGEGMKLQNEEVAIGIIKHSQNDYRRLIVSLGELYRIHGSDTIKISDLQNYTKFTGEKNMDRSIYENTTRLFSQYNGINATLKIFETDKSNMPLMVQQNHFLATNGYLKDKSKLVDLSADLTNIIAHGDVVDNYIYSDQNWSLQETYGFYGCVYPSFKLNKFINTEKLANDARYPYYRPTFSSLYPKDLNRTSTRCINYKNVKSANEYFQNMSIDDYVMAAKFVKSLLEDGRVSECEKLLKEYCLSAQSIMYVLKIDKINGTRKDVPKTIEKKVKEIASEPVKAVVIRKA
jgi:hypothetical protein